MAELQTERNTPVTDGNGRYLSSTATGIDNTQAFANLIAAAGIIGPSAPIGAIAEQTAGTTYQAIIKLSAGKSYKTTTVPYLPDGVSFDCNNASLLITSTTGNGPVFQNNNSGGTPGTVNDSIKNCRVVYVGPQGTSTGIGQGFILATHALDENGSSFGFNIGIVCSGCQLSSLVNPTAAYNNIGVALLPSSFSNVPATIATGYPSVDDNVYNITSRSNKFGLVLNGANTTNFFGGSLSNNTVAPLILGAIDFRFIDTLLVSGGVSEVCTANAAIPLTLTGGGFTYPAEAILQTDANGHSVGTAFGAFIVNGGKVTSVPRLS